MRGNRSFRRGRRACAAVGRGLLASGCLMAAVAMPVGAQTLGGGRPTEEVDLPDLSAIEQGRGGPVRAAPLDPSAFGLSPARPPSVTAASGSEENVKRIGGGAPGETGAPRGLYGIDQGALPGGDATPSPVIPEQHIVKNGDSLWSLCAHYFRDPWRWPKLWAGNPQVTNPHWIFPGDVIRLREAGAPAEQDKKDGQRIKRDRDLGSDTLVLRSIGFIDAGALEESARIVGSREEKMLLASGDQAYLRFAKTRPLRAGDRYSIFVADTDHPIRDPDHARVIGYLVRIYGDVLIDQISNDEMARGSLQELQEPVERGFAVSPHVRPFKRVEPRPSTVTVDARIVASFAPTLMFASENFVVLSRGKLDGVEVGNRSYVVRRGDGSRPLMGDFFHFDQGYPKEVVGELWVMDVKDNASIAWVARSTKELRVGEMTEIRRGY